MLCFKLLLQLEDFFISFRNLFICFAYLLFEVPNGVQLLYGSQLCFRSCGRVITYREQSLNRLVESRLPLAFRLFDVCVGHRYFCLSAGPASRFERRRWSTLGSKVFAAERTVFPCPSFLPARSGKFLASWTSTYFAGDRIEFLGTLLKSGYIRNP